MSLAVVIFDKDGSQCQEVTIDAYAHFRLMRMLDDRRLSFVPKIKNYFEDSSLRGEEVDGFLKEVTALLENCPADDPVRPVLDSLRHIAETACERKATINVVGDYAFDSDG